MIYWGAVLMLTALNGGALERDAEAASVQQTRVSVRHQIIVRMPNPHAPQSSARALQWKEGKGPECVPARLIAGATLLSRNSVDLVLRDNRRVRAELENSCPALDYYHGFYITPNPDGKICADRDLIRSRVGGKCEIERFRSLRPVLKD